MSNQPPPYSRQFNFEDYQSLNPTAPLPGEKVEAELNGARASINQTISRLNEIQNADGSLKTPDALEAETTATATAVATATANSATQAYLAANYDPNVAIDAAASAAAALASKNAAQNAEFLALTHSNYAEQATLSAQNYAGQAATSRAQALNHATAANTSKIETAALAAAVESDFNEVAAVYAASLSLKNWVDSESFQFLHKREDMTDAGAIMLFNDGEAENTLIGKVFQGASVSADSSVVYRPPTSGTSVGNMDIFSGPWWVEGHDSPEDPHKIVMRDMMSCLVDTWLTFGPRVGPWSGGDGNIKLRQNGINGQPNASLHIGPERIKGVNYSQDNFGVGLLKGSEPLTPKGYVDAADLSLSGRIDLKANKSGDTFTGKVNMTPSATTASLNLGSQQASPSLTIAGDIWIGANINYRSFDGIAKAVANTNTTNTFTQPQIVGNSGAGAALRVTQLGTGPALVVEDSTNPDTTAFTIDANGRVGIGVAPGSTAALKVDAGGVMFNDGTTLTTADHNHTISQVTGLQDAINATKLQEYDNFKIYTTNDLVLATNKIFKFNNFVGAAGYGPITHPTYWTEQSAQPNLAPYITTSDATSQFVGKGQPGSVPATGLSGQVLTKLGSSPSACTWEWPSSPDFSPYARLDGATFTGKVTLASIGVASPSLNLGTQCDHTPANVANGDLWVTNASSPKLAYQTGGAIYQVPATNLFNTFSAQNIFDTSSTIPAVRITQRGTGHALIVEDSTNPDTTALVVTNDGTLGIGPNPASGPFVGDASLSVYQNNKNYCASFRRSGQTVYNGEPTVFISGASYGVHGALGLNVSNSVLLIQGYASDGAGLKIGAFTGGTDTRATINEIKIPVTGTGTYNKEIQIGINGVVYFIPCRQGT